ncbi:MAG: AAA family ATPase [Nanoarchaeota archaeon]|nr:AAA family ATPase [Nanoarchaeota archaeon]
MFEEFKKLIADSDFEDIIGMDEIKDELKSALLTERNVILVGPPGCGKTTLAKNIARILPEITVNSCSYGCDPKEPVCPECIAEKSHKKKKIKGEERFVRVQGSPDLTSEDLIGDIDPIKALKFGPMSPKSFTPGKVFKANAKILFFDEINRCSEKLQNSLLQVLEEGKATVSSYDVAISSKFIFIGTMNPGDISTEPLSDVFMDRFDIIYMGYPKRIEDEKKIVILKGKVLADFSDSLLTLMVKFVQDLRLNKDLEKLPSVRATIGLYERAQGFAVLAKRKRVNFSDIEKAIFSVLRHRIELKPSVKYLKKPEDILKKELQRFKTENNVPEKEESDIP